MTPCVVAEAWGAHLAALVVGLHRPAVHGLRGAEHVAETTMLTCSSLKHISADTVSISKGADTWVALVRCLHLRRLAGTCLPVN